MSHFVDNLVIADSVNIGTNPAPNRMEKQVMKFLVLTKFDNKITGNLEYGVSPSVTSVKELNKIVRQSLSVAKLYPEIHVTIKLINQEGK